MVFFIIVLPGRYRLDTHRLKEESVMLASGYYTFRNAHRPAITVYRAAYSYRKNFALTKVLNVGGYCPFCLESGAKVQTRVDWQVDHCQWGGCK